MKKTLSTSGENVVCDVVDHTMDDEDGCLCKYHAPDILVTYEGDDGMAPDDTSVPIDKLSYKDCEEMNHPMLIQGHCPCGAHVADMGGVTLIHNFNGILIETRVPRRQDVTANYPDSF